MNAALPRFLFAIRRPTQGAPAGYAYFGRFTDRIAAVRGWYMTS